MEATEESFVNDRSIMETTVIERQDHSGRIRFKTTLPSGRDLNSEWIQESDKSKAGILWAEAVRGQIVADSQESAAKARRHLKDIKAAQPVVPKILDSAGGSLNSTVPSLPIMAPSAQPAVSAVTPTSADPAAYVRAQHAAARRRLDELKTEKERIALEYAQAQRAEAQWFGLLQAMGIGDSVLEQVSTSRSAVRDSSRGISSSVIVSADPSDGAADDGLSEHDAAE